MHKIFLTLFALLYTASGMICYCARLSVIVVLSCYEIGRSFYWHSNALTWAEPCLCPVPISLLRNLVSKEVQNNRGASTETLWLLVISACYIRTLIPLRSAPFQIIPQAVRTIPVICRHNEMANSVVCSSYFIHCAHCKL